MFLTPDNMLRILAADGARGPGSTLWQSIVADPAEKALAEAKTASDGNTTSTVILDPRDELEARRAAYEAEQAALMAS